MYEWVVNKAHRDLKSSRFERNLNQGIYSETVRWKNSIIFQYWSGHCMMDNCC